MMENRIRLARELLADDGAIFISIDDNEQARLKTLCDAIFGEENFVAQVVWQKKYAATNDSKGFSTTHDYITVYQKSDLFDRNLLPRTDEQNKPYKNDDHDGKGLWRSDNLLVRTFSQSAVYPIVNPNTGEEFYPPKGSCWRASKETMNLWLHENRIYFGKDGKGAPQLKRYLNEVQQGSVPSTWWTFEEVGHNDTANKELQALFGVKTPFDTPKPTTLIVRNLQIATSSDSLVLDFFGGSGTTAHAVINLNREDGGQRKWVVVEAAPYFEAVTKSRIMKAMYSDSWSGGIPSRTGGVSGCIKVLSLEQYKDTLDNLAFEQKNALFEDAGNHKDAIAEDYRLSYMLNVESRESFFSLEWFAHPFNVKMKIRKESESVETKIDLPETFSFLIGLSVEKVKFLREGLLLQEGKARNENKEEKTLAVWRDFEKVNNDVLNSFFEKEYEIKNLNEFDRIYINGDNRLGVLLGEDRKKNLAY